jgi:hypothetical protein
LADALPPSTSVPFSHELRAGEADRLSAGFVHQESVPRELRCVSIELPGLEMAAREIPAGRQAGWTTGVFTGQTDGVGDLIGIAEAQVSRVKFVTPRRVELAERQLTTQTDIAPDGSNLTDVLHVLRSNRPDDFAEIEGFIVGAFPNVRQITIRLNEEQTQIWGETALLYRDRAGQIPLRSCGSGIEQMLVLGVAILSAPAESLILIDEPQAYLHPHAERSLLALLEAHPEHQYVIATHSHQLLRSKPLRQARLISLDQGATRIAQATDGAEVLETLGVTAADLWLSNTVLWVEGTSDEAAFDELITLLPDGERYATIEIRAMPGDAARFAAQSEKKASDAYRFCEEVSDAIAPLPVMMKFLFDADEKPEAFQDTMKARSKGRAVFLSCRELENLFLHPEAVVAAITDRCHELELPLPDRAAITMRLEELLAEVANPRYFPSGAAPGVPASEIVRGSAILRDLFYEFAKSEYDKVKDAPVMVRHTYETVPSDLDPLVKILRELLPPSD